MWLKPVLAPIAIWLDDVLGNGNPNDAKKWWLDLEVIGERSFKYNPDNYVVQAKDANRPNSGPMYIRETIRIIDALDIFEDDRRRLYRDNAAEMFGLDLVDSSR
jgi:hypothetical protein